MTSDRPITRVARQSAFYALGNAAVKLSGLLLAPLYLDSHYLTLEEYGSLALLLVASQIGIFVVGMGIGTGLLKFSVDPAMAPARDRLPFTALLTTVAFSVLAWLICYRGAAVLSTWILGTAGRSAAIVALGTYVAYKTVGTVPMMLLRIQERAGLFALVIALEMALLIGGVYVFLVIRGEGLVGVMSAYVWSAGVTTLSLTGLTLARIRWRFDAGLLAPLFRYGSPLVLVSLASLVLNAGDRYMLNAFMDTATVGLYEWASRIAGVLHVLVVQSFQLAFTVVGLKTLGEGESNLHRRAFRHYTIWAGWAVLGLALAAYDGTRWLTHLGADPYYLEAAGLVLPLAFGFFIYGNYVIITNVLYGSWKTPVIGAMVVGAALLNVALNAVAIPLAGTAGAALATVAAYGALAGTAYVLADRERPIEYPWSVFSIVVGSILGLYVLGIPTQEWTPIARVAARVGLLLVYPALIFGFGLYSRDEWRRAWTGWQRPGPYSGTPRDPGHIS